MDETFDFKGWATKINLKCGDGRTIMPGAFKKNNGKKVPIVWNHQHDSVKNVLGHAYLEYRPDGIYANGVFNTTEDGQRAKVLVQSGDIDAMSILASQLKQDRNRNVFDGDIKEVSLVLAGSNPGALIEDVMAHGELSEEEAYIFTGEYFEDELSHSGTDEPDDGTDDPEDVTDDPDDNPDEPEKDSSVDEQLEHAATEDPPPTEKTKSDIFNSMSDEQKNLVYEMIEIALGEDSTTNNEDPEGGYSTMKHNAFDNGYKNEGPLLTHSAQVEIIKLAKTNAIGTLRGALAIYAEEHNADILKHGFEDSDDFLKHGFDDIDALFPEYKDVKPGAPELITRDQGWVGVVMRGTHKSPISRIRTRQMDARGADLRGKGYVKGTNKTNNGVAKLLSRTTDPQTVYVKDFLQRDDVIDIADFYVVAYQYGIMLMDLNEEIAMAIMVGDSRDDGDADKIHEDHIRPIWTDNELYTIHTDVDIQKTQAELQGTNTGASFGANFIYAEAIITAALYSREKFKGSGTPTLFCTPHLLNVMLLARDLNGRRIYTSTAEIASALNVTDIQTAEQFDGLVRNDSQGDPHSLLGIFVNLADYQVGATKGGEITRFEDFDIDFNQYKYLIETRLSGALTRIYSAIVLEMPGTSAIPNLTPPEPEEDIEAEG
jgi:HK97 family phage prohead protease